MSALAGLPFWADALIALMLLVSAFPRWSGSLALVRFCDFYKRLHGPTKATTLGVGGVLIASSVYFSLRGSGFSVHEFLITLFLFLTAPGVGAHAGEGGDACGARRSAAVPLTSRLVTWAPWAGRSRRRLPAAASASARHRPSLSPLR